MFGDGFDAARNMGPAHGGPLARFPGQGVDEWFVSGTGEESFAYSTSVDFRTIFKGPLPGIRAAKAKEAGLFCIKVGPGPWCDRSRQTKTLPGRNLLRQFFAKRPALKRMGSELHGGACLPPEGQLASRGLSRKADRWALLPRSEVGNSRPAI